MVAVAGVARDEYRLGAAAAGFGETAPDEGRMAAGGKADDHVVRLDRAGFDGASTGVGIIFGAFDRTPDRLIAAGHDALHEPRRRTEGRRAFAGVEDAETAAGAGAAIEEAAPGGEGADNLVDGPFDVHAFREDLAGEGRVLVEHQADRLRHGHLGETDGLRVAAFGRCGSDGPPGSESGGGRCRDGLLLGVSGAFDATGETDGPPGARAGETGDLAAGPGGEDLGGDLIGEPRILEDRRAVEQELHLVAGGGDAGGAVDGVLAEAIGGASQDGDGDLVLT